MKKLICCGLLLLLALALGCAAAQAETTTLLVYMCGTDLQSDACEDLYEMADAENGEDVNIVVCVLVFTFIYALLRACIV